MRDRMHLSVEGTAQHGCHWFRGVIADERMRQYRRGKGVGGVIEERADR